jgi:hypothetical protein
MLQLIYFQSKLLVLGFNRQKFELAASSDQLWTSNNSSNTFFTVIFTLVISAVPFLILLGALTSSKALTTSFFLVALVTLLLGVLAFRHFLWLIKGRQELLLKSGQLILHKKGTFLTSPHVFDLNRVDNIRKVLDDSELTMFDKIIQNLLLNHKLLFSHILGQVLFDYDGSTVKVFCKLNKAERDELYVALKKWREGFSSNLIKS